MSYGTNGSVIGPDNVPTASVASGVWSLGEVAEALRDDIWPAPKSSQYEWIAGTTFDGSTASHTFSAIPQTYNSLKIVLYVKPTSPTFRPYIRINGETGSNYKMVEFGSSSGSYFSAEVSSTALYYSYDAPAASIAMVMEADLDGYTNSSMFSPVQHMWGSLDGSTRAFGASQGNYQSGTAAITSVQVLDTDGDDPAAGSTVALFGYKDA